MGKKTSISNKSNKIFKNDSCLWKDPHVVFTSLPFWAICCACHQASRINQHLAFPKIACFASMNHMADFKWLVTLAVKIGSFLTQQGWCVLIRNGLYRENGLVIFMRILTSNWNFYSNCMFSSLCAVEIYFKIIKKQSPI